MYPPQVSLGLYNKHDPEIEIVVRPHYLQLVPPMLRKVLVHQRRINAKIGYQEPYGAIQQAEGGIKAFLDDVSSGFGWRATPTKEGAVPQNAVPSVVHYKLSTATSTCTVV